MQNFGRTMLLFDSVFTIKNFKYSIITYSNVYKIRSSVCICLPLTVAIATKKSWLSHPP